MEVEDIIKTFAEHKAALDKFYRSNQKVPDHRWQPEHDYLVILNGLLRETQQQKMYLKIKSVFAKESANHISSNVGPTLKVGILNVWFIWFNFCYRISAWKSILERNGTGMGVVDIHGKICTQPTRSHQAAVQSGPRDSPTGLSFRFGIVMVGTNTSHTTTYYHYFH